MFVPFVARLSLVGAVVLASPSLYAARVAVLSPKVESDSPVSEGRRNKFHDSLTQGLTEAAGGQWTVLSSEEVRQRLAGREDLLSCQQGSCVGQVASQLQIDRVVVPKITMKSVVGGNAYQILLTAIDPSGKQSDVIFAERCGDDSEGCNLSRAFESMRKTASGLPAKLTVTAPASQPRPACPAGGVIYRLLSGSATAANGWRRRSHRAGRSLSAVSWEPLERMAGTSPLMLRDDRPAQSAGTESSGVREVDRRSCTRGQMPASKGYRRRNAPGAVYLKAERRSRGQHGNTARTSARL